MTQQISVRLLPSLIDPDEMIGATAIVIDVLRATSTICNALGSGATSVFPCLEIEQAECLRSDGKADVCGGERNCIQIEGFNFSNSPFDYTKDAVNGKSIAFTTTNGTRAMKACESADEIYLASFLNLSTVVEQISKREKIVIVCAGTNGNVTSEDVLLAGAIVDGLTVDSDKKVISDEARIASEFWNAESSLSLNQRLRQSLGGRNLLKLGCDKDIEFCSQVDLYNFNAKLDLSTWKIKRVER